MNTTSLGRVLTSSVGLKAVMAVTGAVWVIFVIAHWVGNMLVYVSPKAINDYGWFIQEGSHGAVWVLRITVLVAILAHIWAAWLVARRSWEARPQNYAGGRKTNRASYAGITMRYGGPALLLFILFHLSHMTLGWTHPDFQYGNVYHNLVIGFTDPVISSLYIASMVALGLHLYHGIRSGVQTVGLASLDSTWPTVLAGVIAVVVAVGNISFPVSVMAGFLDVNAVAHEEHP